MRAQTISFVEHGFERLGLSHRTVVSRSVHTKVSRVRLRSQSPQCGLGGSDFLAFFPSLFPGLLASPFILACIPYPTFTCRFDFFRTDICPISSYSKWLGVVVKAEEHGSVRCRVFNGSNGSFPFVLGRHTVQRSFIYQHRYFRFFPKLFLYRSYPFFQEDLGNAEDRIILGYISRLLGLLLYVLGYIPSRFGLWAPM